MYIRNVIVHCTLSQYLNSSERCIADSDRRLLMRIPLRSALDASLQHFEIAVIPISCIFMPHVDRDCSYFWSSRLYSYLHFGSTAYWCTRREERKREKESERVRGWEGRGERAFFEAASICGHRPHGPATARRRTNRDGFCVRQLAFVLVRFSEAKRHVRLTVNTEGRPTTWCSRLSYFWRWFSFCQDDG